MSQKFLFYEIPVLELYFELLDEIIKEEVKHEWTEYVTKTLPKPNKLSTFKLCNPFWLTLFILRGVFKFLFSTNNKQVVVVKTKPIKYRNVNNFSDDDSDESEVTRPFSALSKQTQTNQRDLERTGFEGALTDLINLRKFKDIVPANRKAVKKMASSLNLFRRIDERNRHRYGGKVIKSKLKASGSKIFGRPKTAQMETNANEILSVHDILNHILYVESSDDEDFV